MTTKEQADEQWGPIVWQGLDRVVRVKCKSVGSEPTVYMHKKDSEGHEEIPLAYMYGLNILGGKCL